MTVLRCEEDLTVGDEIDLRCRVDTRSSLRAVRWKLGQRGRLECKLVDVGSQKDTWIDEQRIECERELDVVVSIYGPPRTVSPEQAGMDNLAKANYSRLKHNHQASRITATR